MMNHLMIGAVSRFLAWMNNGFLLSLVTSIVQFGFRIQEYHILTYQLQYPGHTIVFIFML